MMDWGQLAPQEMSLGDLLEVARRRRWTILQTIAVVTVLGIVATAMMRPVYRAKSKLLVQATTAQINAMDTQNPLVDLLAMAQPPSVETQLQVLQSEPFIDSVLRLSDVRRGPDGLYEPQIRASAIRETNVIEVTVDSQERRTAARVANAMLDEYQQQAREQSREEITSAREFIEREATRAQQDLARIEQESIAFRQANRIAELTAAQQFTAQELVAVQSKAVEVDNNIARVEAQMEQVRQAIEREPVEKPVPSEKENPRIDVLQAKLAELELQRAGLVAEYQEDSPRVALLDAQIARARHQLAAEPPERRLVLHAPNPVRDEMIGRMKSLRIELKGLQAARRQYQGELVRWRQQLNQLGPWEIQLNQLNRARETTGKRYLTLVDRLSDLQIREHARRNMTRILERARPPRVPVRPRRVLNLALSLLLGAVFGVCLAFLQEYLDDRLTTPEEVDRLLRLPVLGHVPIITGDSRRLMTLLPAHSPIAESYRTLRTSIRFASVDPPLRTIIVTSTRQGEGKSTTSVNLAIAMALEGRQVILVDGDLRRPNIHRLLGLAQGPGLTDLLLSHRGLDELLRPTEVGGLRVLTSGPIPPNPAELLSSGPMNQVIQELQATADVVIFDTPPCLPVTDSQVLAAKVDGVLIVAELGQARKAEVRHARELFDRVHARVVGLIFNKSSESVGGYRHYYHHRYGEDVEEVLGNGKSALPAMPLSKAAVELRSGGGALWPRSGQRRGPGQGGGDEEETDV